MADTIAPNSKPQTLAADAPSDNASPSKFFRHFLYKAVLITVFLVLLPIFPSIAPEFINQTLHARSWELLQLIFVGIAVSYGLFSKKNDDVEKDQYGSKLDNAQSYVSKLLQVSSVFDDESESQTVIDDNKVQTWSSQYYRGEPPMVVMAKESPIVAEETGAVSELGGIQKPLLLPVRSLKQRLSENEAGGKIRLGVNSGSRRFVRNSRRLRSEDVAGVSDDRVEDVLEDNNVVLRSPIPWRSRSGRMEMKDHGNGDGSSSLEDQELSRIESRFSKPPKLNSGSKNLSPSSTSRRMSPSMSFTSESQADETFARKKGFVSPPPVPPPPPPPPPPTSQYARKPMLTKSNSSVVSNAAVSKKMLSRSVRSVPTEELSETEMEEEPIARTNQTSNDVSPLGKSVRTFRPNDMVFEGNFVEKKRYSDTTPNAKLPNELMEKGVVESSDEDSESDNEVNRTEGSTCYGEAAIGNNGGNELGPSVDGNELGPDVDKKAAEFIAKFREQIRLQRIESIRKSTVQRTGRTFR